VACCGQALLFSVIFCAHFQKLKKSCEPHKSAMACVFVSAVVANDDIDSIRLTGVCMNTSELPTVDKIHFGSEAYEKSLQVS
jgi:hypothetical protein